METVAPVLEAAVPFLEVGQILGEVVGQILEVAAPVLEEAVGQILGVVDLVLKAIVGQTLEEVALILETLEVEVTKLN